MNEDFTENEETITNPKDQIQITNSYGTFILSRAKAVESFREYLIDTNNTGAISQAFATDLGFWLQYFGEAVKSKCCSEKVVSSGIPFDGSNAEFTKMCSKCGS